MTQPSPDIPDFVPAGLEELLRQRTGGNPPAEPLGAIPQVDFSEQDPGELVVLLTMLIQQAKSKPDHKQMVLLLQMLSTVLSQSFKDMVDQALEDTVSPRASLGLVCHMATSLGMITLLINKLADAYHHTFGARFRPEVSDQFLESVGLTRQQYETWLKTSGPKKA